MPGTTPLDKTLPKGIFGFIWRISARDQILLSILAVAVFLLNTAPLEIQRRVVNDAIKNPDFTAIFWLALAYAGVELLHGGLKYLMNVYRGWIGEKATRRLRLDVHATSTGAQDSARDGIEVAVVVAETEAVGGFVGMGISEPLLQGGLLVSVFGYMAWLQPWMALLCAVLFIPQAAVVPWLQRVINRRAAERIVVLREVSAGIVAHPELVDGADDGFEAGTQKVFELNIGIFRLKYGLNFIMNTLYHVSVAGVLGVGGWLVVHGQIEAGTVVAFLTGLHRTRDPWSDLINFLREWSVANVKYHLIADLQARFEATPAKS